MMVSTADTGSLLTSREDGGATATAMKSPRQVFQERIHSLLAAPMPRCLQSTLQQENTHASRHTYNALHQTLNSSHRSRSASSTPEAATRAALEVNRSRREVRDQSATRHDASPSPPLPIYEQLLQKGRLQQEHREELRQAAIEREMRELRPAPRVPPSAAPSTLPPEGQRIEDRLLRRAQERAAQAAEAARQRQQREAEDVAAIATFHPRISAHARATKARYKDVQTDRAAWRAARLEELAQTRHVAEMEELREVQPGPVINRHSARLAAERKARDGLTGLPASEALVLTEHRRRLAQWQAAEAEREARASASPAITHRAAAMHRAGEVGTRLHAESYDAAVRRLQREVAWREASTPFQPEVTTLAAVTAPRYQREGNEATSRRASSALRSRSSSSFQPTINAVSAAIAERLPETAMERLCRPVAVHSLSTYADPEKSVDVSAVSPGQRTPRDAAYAPSPSSQLSSAAMASLDAYERRRQARLEALRREQSAQELQECTFQPSVNTRSEAMVAAAGENGKAAQRGPRAVAMRNDEWQQQRERHVETMRQWQEERAAAAELDAVRLRGQQQQRHSTPAPSSSPSVYGGDGRAWGVDAYLARQQLARQQRQERQHGETLRDYRSPDAQSPAALPHRESASASPFYPSHTYDSGASIRSLRPPVSAAEAPFSARLWTSGAA